MRRPHDPPNPETVPEILKLIADSTELDGAGYRTNIADGLNPFGDSDYYISVYRGWLRLPVAGTYGFCTCSNEASFSFLDGQELVSWPGRHTEERGRFGQKNAERPVSEGLHYVEYLQEEVTLYQMSFLGYKPPGVKGYVGIPDYLFLQPHRAAVQRYESADGKRLIVPHPELIDSRWPTGRADGQDTREKLAADAGAEPIDWGQWSIQWLLGDGLTADGHDAEHVYLKLGHYNVTMTATGPVGQKIQRNWPLTVFEVDHVVAGFKQGQLAPYAAIAGKYDPAKLATPSLVELARLMNEAGDRPATQRAATLPPSSGPTSPQTIWPTCTCWPRPRRSAPGAGSASGGGAASATIDKGNRGSPRSPRSPKETNPGAARVQILARCIPPSAWTRSNPDDAAQKLYAQAEHEAKASSMSREMRTAFREATVAIGDVHLFNRIRSTKADEDYHTAEALDDSPMPVQVKLSKVGAFPEAIEQQLEHKRIGDAMEVARRWQHEVPSDQIHGTVLYYIGKLEYVQTRPAAAIRPLQMSIDLAQGAEFEAEARWILAQAYRDTGDQRGVAVWTLTGLREVGASAGRAVQKAIDALAAVNDTMHGFWRNQGLKAGGRLVAATGASPGCSLR